MFKKRITIKTGKLKRGCSLLLNFQEYVHMFQIKSLEGGLKNSNLDPHFLGCLSTVLSILLQRGDLASRIYICIDMFQQGCLVNLILFVSTSILPLFQASFFAFLSCVSHGNNLHSAFFFFSSFFFPI